MVAQNIKGGYPRAQLVALHIYGERMRIFFIVRSLDPGGAERQLAHLAKGLAARSNMVWVGVFYAGGALEEELRKAGVVIVDLGKRRRTDIFVFSNHARRAVAQCDPDIVYSFLDVANILNAMITRRSRSAIVFGIRASAGEPDRLSRIVSWIEAKLSWRADLVISNSHAAALNCAEAGFDPAIIRVIANGIDTERYSIDAERRRRFRATHDIADDRIVVGMLARLAPSKGHEIFLQAARLLAKDPRFCFMIAGKGHIEMVNAIEEQAHALGISGRVKMLGGLADPSDALAGFDILCSASRWGEGFSNSIAEAMASGTPCVVTDIGDSALIVADVGEVVPPDQPEALAAAVLRISSILGTTLSAANRAQITSHYSIEQMVVETEIALQLIVDI